MSEFETKHARGPIFVVGSPRSGTSILTWCLGQHPNILPQEESDWMGEFAVDVGVCYRVGKMHGERSQLNALGVDRETFFQTFGDGIDAMVRRHRQQLEKNCRQVAERSPSQPDPNFNISRSSSEPKLRWVDGTPEYSFYICGLRKLFPDAKFVHIVRDVRSVVNSMLNFKLTGHCGLVDTEQQAYEYWLTTVQACVQAERALGSDVVHRLHYDDLVHRSEWALRGVLEFLNEPFTESCTEPVARKINSSEVPVDFRAHDPKTDSGVIERALELSEQLQRPFDGYVPCPVARAEFEEGFSERIDFMIGLDNEYRSAQEKVAKLANGLNWCGLVLVAYVLLAGTAILGESLYGQRPLSIGGYLWLASALAGAGIYAFIRRAGLGNFAARVFSRYAHRRASSPAVPLRAKTVEHAPMASVLLRKDVGTKQPR